MSQKRWDIEEIELLRLQINDLQQQREIYNSGVKKLGKIFFREVLTVLKHKLNKKNNKKTLESNFLTVNPNFKPYSIQTKKDLSSSKLPKILHVIPDFGTGGSQQLIVDLIEGLNQYTHEIAVRIDKGEIQGYIGVTVHNCSSLYSLEGFKSLLEIVKPDIVHVHYWGRWEDGYWEWKWYHHVFQGSFAYGCAVIENCNNPLMPYLNNKIKKYVYVSKYAKDTFGVKKLPNKVIYPGSNFSYFHRAGSQPEPNTIGMVYRLDQDKLNQYSIDPLIRTVQKRPGTKALVVGGGYYLELFKQKVADAGLEKQFTFPGYVAYEHLADYYRQMAIFVAPVHKESFGQVTPFAMNMAIPVVAYNVGALEEILVNQDVLAPEQDVEAMSDILVNLLNDQNKRITIGAYNQARAQSLFSVQTMVSEYRDVYQAALSANEPVVN